MNTFDLTIATLDKSLFQGQVSAAYFPTPHGEIGVLTDHATYLTDTLAGTIRCTEENGTQTNISLPHSGVFFIENNKARLWVA